MQTYVVVMAILVVGGTLFDILHKRSAQYFFDNWRDSRKEAKKQVGAGKMIGLAAETAVVDVALSGEFCNPRRRAAHLLTMYGFLLYAIMTAIIVFSYPTRDTATPAILPFSGTSAH